MNNHGIDFDRTTFGDSVFAITTPSFHGIAARLDATGSVSWEVSERDTNRHLGEGSAETDEDAIDQMTAVMAANA